MINAIQPQHNLTPMPSASAVNIQIFNPQAYAGAPVNPPVQYRAWNSTSNQQSLYNTGDDAVNYPPNYNNQSLNLDKKADKREVAKNTLEEQENKEKTIKPLTDEDIKRVEGYLNDKDTKTRLIGAKELLEMFKADSKRANDPSLVALLNKILQDESASVRFVGLTVLDVGYAKGNDETVRVLSAISQNPSDEYQEDRLLAQQILSGIQSNNVK